MLKNQLKVQQPIVIVSASTLKSAGLPKYDETRCLLKIPISQAPNHCRYYFSLRIKLAGITFAVSIDF